MSLPGRQTKSYDSRYRSGTGERLQRYDLYRLGARAVERWWSGDGFVLEWPEDARAARKERVGFVRFEQPGYGHDARLLHCVFDVGEKRWTTKTYVLRNGAFTAVAESTGVVTGQR